jgi:hypothetical protein
MTDDHESFLPRDVAPATKLWWQPEPMRDDLPVISARRAYGEVLFVYSCFFLASIAVAISSLLTHVGASSYTWSQSIASSINQVAVGALAVSVPLLLSARRGVQAADLGLSRSIFERPAQALRIAGWCFLGFISGSLVSGLLSSRKFPFPTLNGSNLMIELFHALQAGPLEEIVVLGFVVTTLQQARRPTWEIVIVALALRDAYHLYYGFGAIGIFVWASLFLWLFFRFRTLWPLIIVHCVWDVVATLVTYWKVVGAFEIFAILVLWVACTITWLIMRSNARPVAFVAGR